MTSQTDMLSGPWPVPWVDGSIPPKPGQLVLKYYRDDSGEIRGPIIATPVHADGSHLIDGRSIYRPAVCWMPLPELPHEYPMERAA